MVLEKMSKYVLPDSVTFWIGLLMVVSGILEFIDVLYPLGWVGYILTAAYGNMSPFTLVLTGSGTITMRAAIK